MLAALCLAARFATASPQTTINRDDGHSHRKSRKRGNATCNSITSGLVSVSEREAQPIPPEAAVLPRRCRMGMPWDVPSHSMRGSFSLTTDMSGTASFLGFRLLTLTKGLIRTTTSLPPPGLRLPPPLHCIRQSYRPALSRSIWLSPARPGSTHEGRSGYLAPSSTARWSRLLSLRLGLGLPLV